MELAKIIETCLGLGYMTEAEHDKLIKQVHADGRIDSSESTLLSTLFAAVQTGKIKIVRNTSPADDPSMAESYKHLQYAKREALKDDYEKIERVKHTVSAPTQVHTSSATDSQTRPAIHSVQNSEPNLQTPRQGRSLSLFTTQAHTPRTEGATFCTLNDRLLDVKLSGTVWSKSGAMVAYNGKMSFTREGIVEHGLAKTLKRAITGEGAFLTKASGVGNLYLADQGKKISIIDLQGAAIYVAGKNVLAFEESVEWDITYMKQIAAFYAGGLFHMRLSGKGMLAISSFYDPLVLRVTPVEPLMTDMNATVAWSGGLAPQFQTDISGQTLIGRTSGETVQLRFEGDGFVVIQPFEEGGNSPV